MSAANADKMRKRSEEGAKREGVESQVAALRAQFEQQALLNKTALAEARQSVMDARPHERGEEHCRRARRAEASSPPVSRTSPR